MPNKPHPTRLSSVLPGRTESRKTRQAKPRVSSSSTYVPRWGRRASAVSPLMLASKRELCAGFRRESPGLISERWFCSRNLLKPGCTRGSHMHTIPVVGNVGHFH